MSFTPVFNLGQGSGWGGYQPQFMASQQMPYWTDIQVYPFIGNTPIGIGAVPYSAVIKSEVLNRPGMKFYDGPTGTQLSQPPQYGDRRLDNNKPYHVANHDGDRISFHNPNRRY